METMLKVSDLYVSYGHIEALRGVSVEVKRDRLYRSLVRMEPEKVHYCVRFQDW